MQASRCLIIPALWKRCLLLATIFFIYHVWLVGWKGYMSRLTLLLYLDCLYGSGSDKVKWAADQSPKLCNTRNGFIDYCISNVRCTWLFLCRWYGESLSMDTVPSKPSELHVHVCVHCILVPALYSRGKGVWATVCACLSRLSQWNMITYVNVYVYMYIILQKECWGNCYFYDCFSSFVCHCTQPARM